MGFGEAAKAALSKAIEALQAIAEVKAIVQQIQLAGTNFERRIEARTEALEARIRELERENAKLHGMINSAYTEAFKSLVLEMYSRGSKDGLGRLPNVDGGNSELPLPR